jgi:hypothetical protein
VGYQTNWETPTEGDRVMSGKIRLACGQCDRMDFDGIDSIPDDWDDVSEFQSYGRAIAMVKPDDNRRSVMEWYTHIGTCPDCQKHEEQESESS